MKHVLFGIVLSLVACGPNGVPPEPSIDSSVVKPGLVGSVCNDKPDCLAGLECLFVWTLNRNVCTFRCYPVGGQCNDTGICTDVGDKFVCLPD